MDWIFAHPELVVGKMNTIVACALAAPAGFTENDMWGPAGEGATLFANCAMVLDAAAPFIQQHDKAGWLARCAENVRRRR